MGCTITKDKIESKMLFLKLRRVNIRNKRKELLELLKEITGKKIVRPRVKKYVISNSSENYDDQMQNINQKKNQEEKSNEQSKRKQKHKSKDRDTISKKENKSKRKEERKDIIEDIVEEEDDNKKDYQIKKNRNKKYLIDKDTSNSKIKKEKKNKKKIIIINNKNSNNKNRNNENNNRHKGNSHSQSNSIDYISRLFPNKQKQKSGINYKENDFNELKNKKREHIYIYNSNSINYNNRSELIESQHNDNVMTSNLRHSAKLLGNNYKRIKNLQFEKNKQKPFNPLRKNFHKMRSFNNQNYESTNIKREENKYDNEEGNNTYDEVYYPIPSKYRQEKINLLEKENNYRSTYKAKRYFIK